jgi:hypothetical protein
MTRARNLGRLANTNTLSADNTNNFVGIGSTQPDARLDVDGTVLVGTAITIGGASGIVSATAFYGDGSNLDGVASAGLGTALAEEGVGSVIYYTENTLGIGSTFVVTVPTGSDVAYTQYSEVSLDENVDLIVTDGDDFVPDILGLSTTGINTSTGIGGRIRAGTFTNKAGTGAPQLTFGAEIPVGYGLTGAGGINVGGAATIGGNLTVGGVLTYDDVTNVDSLGIVTARGGVEFGASGVGGTITAAGAAEFVGVVTTKGGLNVVGGGATVTGIATFHGGADFNSLLKESVNITAGKLSDNTNINLDNGMLHLFTTAETTTATPNIISNTGINTDLSVGDALSVTVVTTAAAAGYAATVHIDGLSLGANAGSLNWTGGTAPTAGGASGVDIYAYTIMKTASNKYTVIASLTKTSA